MDKVSQMKKSLVLLTLLILALSCSSDDDVLSEDVYFKADVDGESFEVNEFSGLISTEKRMTTIGTVDLAVKVESTQGKSIEFVIMNYNGKNSYSLGDGFYNENWIKYSQASPLGSWGSVKILVPALEISTGLK